MTWFAIIEHGGARWLEIGHGRAAPSSWRDKRVQQRARQSLLAKLPFFTEAKSARMAVMAHALKPVAARDKNIEY